MAILEVKNVKKVYTTRFGSVKVQALSDVNFSVEEGEYVAIMGESGSGKTTLLNILASLDKATSGQVLLRGQNVSGIRQKELCAFRREHLGFVFQEFNLLDSLCRSPGGCPSTACWKNIRTKCQAGRNSARPPVGR